MGRVDELVLVASHPCILKRRGETKAVGLNETWQDVFVGSLLLILPL